MLRAIKRRHGRRFAVALLVPLVAFSAPPAAAFKVLITKSDDGLMTFYGDPKSIVHRGDALRIRLLFDYRELQQDPDTLIEHRSTVELASVECRNRRIAAVQATSYSRNMGRGRKVIAGERVPDERLRYVVAKPASIDDKVVSFACAPGDARTTQGNATDSTRAPLTLVCTLDNIRRRITFKASAARQTLAQSEVSLAGRAPPSRVRAQPDGIPGLGRAPQVRRFLLTIFTRCRTLCEDDTQAYPEAPTHGTLRGSASGASNAASRVELDRAQASFPKPLALLASGAVWDGAAIRAWLAQQQLIPGDGNQRAIENSIRPRVQL